MQFKIPARASGRLFSFPAEIHRSAAAVCAGARQGSPQVSLSTSSRDRASGWHSVLCVTGVPGHLKNGGPGLQGILNLLNLTIKIRNIYSSFSLNEVFNSIKCMFV